MAFNPTVYNPRQYEVAAISNTATSLAPGTAVKVMTLPTGLSSPDFYFKVEAAGTADTVFGVVSNQGVASGPSITDTVNGRVVLMNTGLLPVLMSAAGNKGDFIKVKTADGKWGPIGAGETADAQLTEAGVMNQLAWAKPIKIKP